MATNSVQFDGIRLQAERVVRAYKALRDGNKGVEGDDLPLNLFGDLFQQLRQLEHWLQPVEGAEPLAREKGVNEAFGERVGQRVDSALICIERARRIADVCGAAVDALECENSADIALTIGNELFEAIDGARKALAGEA